MDYHNKYLKYKNKYIGLKTQQGGFTENPSLPTIAPIIPVGSATLEPMSEVTVMPLPSFMNTQSPKSNGSTLAQQMPTQTTLAPQMPTTLAPQMPTTLAPQMPTQTTVPPQMPRQTTLAPQNTRNEYDANTSEALMSITQTDVPTFTGAPNMSSTSPAYETISPKTEDKSFWSSILDPIFGNNDKKTQNKD